MLKQSALLLLLTLLVSCGEDVTKVISNNARVSDLERRMALNEQLDASQSLLIQANADAIAAESAARSSADEALEDSLEQEKQERIAADDELRSLIQAEAAARQAGDDSLAADLQIEIANRIAGDQHSSAALAASVLYQSLVNMSVQFSLSSINFRLNQLSSSLSSLQSRVNSLEYRIEDLEEESAQLSSQISLLQVSLNARIDTVAAQAAAAQAQINQQGVQLFKCNSASSTERIMKINGKFYAAMNRVTTESIQVITGATPQTVVVPKLCVKSNGDLALAYSSGQCPSNGHWSAVPGTGISVLTQPHSVTSKVVVTSVKIALDILSDGSYSTTDGGPACHFSISGGGSAQSGLIAVQ